MLGAMSRLFWNWSKRVSPPSASRTIRMLHHSPTRSRLRAIGHDFRLKLFRCMEISPRLTAEAAEPAEIFCSALTLPFHRSSGDQEGSAYKDSPDLLTSCKKPVLACVTIMVQVTRVE